MTKELNETTVDQVRDENNKTTATTNDREEKKGEDLDFLLKRGVELYKDDRLLEAARVLNSVVEKERQLKQNGGDSVLTNEHLNILYKAQVGEDMVTKLKLDIDENSGKDTNANPWIKQGLTKGHNPTLICYQLETSKKKEVQITVRVETPIHKSLLVPILSVLNETELYSTWLPNWSTPRFQIRRVVKIAQSGRASQVLLVTLDLPWPISSRELVLSAMAFDDIELNGDIAIHMTSINDDDEKKEGMVLVPEGVVIPSLDDKSIVRVDLEGGFLFRSCPVDHPTLKAFYKEEQQQKLKKNKGKGEKGKESSEAGDGDGDGDGIILVTFCAKVNPKLKFIPQSFINFIMRTVMGTAWKMLLKVAEDVRDGKREEHASAIEKKRSSLYDWVDARVKAMISRARSILNMKNCCV